MLGQLLPKYKNSIEALLARHPLAIYTTDKEIGVHAPLNSVDWAGTIQGKLFFRLSAIPPRFADFVLLHEMMHMYVEERDGVTPSSLQFDALASRLLRPQGGPSLLQKIELEVESLTRQEAERLEIARPKNTADDRMLEMLIDATRFRRKLQGGL